MDTKIEELEQETKKVQQQIDAVEGQLPKAATEADAAYLWEKKKELRNEQMQLRNKQMQLRNKQMQLRNEQMQLREMNMLLLKAGTTVKLDQWLRQQLPSKQFFFGGQSSFSASEAEADEMTFGVQKWNVIPDIDAYLESQAAGEKRFPPLTNTILHVPVHASEFDLQALMKTLLQYIGENTGLTQFDGCCERLVSSSIKIHQKLTSASKTAISLASSNSSRHRIEIVLKLGGRPFCVVEMKLPVFFRKNMNDGHPDLVDIISESLENRDASNHLFHGVLQLWNDFVNLDLGFGILSSADLSYLVRREGNTLHISDSIQWEDTRLIGAFAYLIYMASSAEPNQFKKEESTSGSDMGDASAHVGGKRGDDSDGGGGGTGDVSETGTIGMRLRNGKVVSCCELTAAEDLHLEDGLVGEGWSGCIVRGTYNGRPVAVKLAIVGSDVAEALVNEVAAYHRLVKYWGRYVPVLVSHGITAFGHVQYVATELIKGFELGIEALTKEVATASFAALDAIHSSGILHGDIRHANILVPKGGQDGVRFIDFGFSQPILDSNSKYCKMERAQLQNIIDKLSVRSLRPFKQEGKALKRLHKAKEDRKEVVPDKVEDEVGGLENLPVQKATPQMTKTFKRFKRNPA